MGTLHCSIDKIASLIGARKYGDGEATVDWLLTDSRSLAFPEVTLFFALRTRLGDGHRYIAPLYKRGVRSFVVENLPVDYKNYPGAHFLLVTNSLKALQRLAERHREAYDLPVLGITGSNGKTVVKEWLYQLLSPSKNVTRSPRSYNSQIGVPLSVWLLDENSQVAIFEAGISQPGEMAALRSIIQPTIGVMTNLGAAHQENFSTLKEKCAEKLQLFKDCQLLIYDADDSIVVECIKEMAFRGEHLAWSYKDTSAPLFIQEAEVKDTDTHIIYIYKGKQHALTLPFTDAASLQNGVHCLTAALALGLTPEEIAERAVNLETVAMRLEVKPGDRGLTLINDSYNSDINSLDIALDFMQRRSQHGSEAKRPTTLILSDILQSGMEGEALYGRVAEMVCRRGVNRIIGVGRDVVKAADAFTIEKYFFETTQELEASTLLHSLHDEIVLLKGSRRYNFERLAEQLSRKVNETVLEINLEALVENLNYYRRRMEPQTKIVCMVKASGYGTGSVEIAKTLQERGVDYLAVAVADEGVELRKAGVAGNIIVMNPEASSFGKLFEYSLEPEVYSFALLEALIRSAEKEGVSHFPIHLKMDTGMHRLGFNPQTDVPELIAILSRQSALVPRSVFSHFVGSDSPDFDAFTEHQFSLFTQAADSLQSAFPYKILRHICNTAAIERFPERHLDMVRLGLGLYGVDPVSNRVLKCVTALKTIILQIHDVPAGDSVGYSRKTFVERPSRIATLPIGYADGLNRRLGNRHAYCLVNGHKAPYVGNICMDVCMIDVTDIPCQEGDAVEIFGEHLPVTYLSDKLETIPYEVLTAVSERVKRVYFQ
ncbi:MAG: bifunctional UDP-N-acetylmuramoyl-tripeptide:D-alanyl-D-alanine ligase/alanine racemase [Bacteroidaceae bacterium]|nr:bifunctional UDP-N-acetylmuramoyl-tripeptide:D-alanyl-D-alanine ligase/alanine racemase [Bacteroidaceae bacterium]